MSKPLEPWAPEPPEPSKARESVEAHELGEERRAREGGEPSKVPEAREGGEVVETLKAREGGEVVETLKAREAPKRGKPAKERQGPGAEGVTTLKGVNAAPAQTWNWLHINETSLQVPSPPCSPTASAQATSTPAEPLPAWAKDVPLACGDEAAAWLYEAARAWGTSRVVRVEAGAHYQNTIEVGGPTASAGDAGASGATASSATTSASAPTASSPTASALSLWAGAGSTVRLSVVATGGQPASGSVVRVQAQEGAQVCIDVVVAAQGAGHLQALGATLGQGATLTLRTWLLGGAPCVLGVATDLVGHQSTASHELRYVAGAGERLDVTYTIGQKGRLTRANVDAYGVLAQGAQKTLRATINLVRGCKGSHGSETETVLVSGPNVRNQTLPVILCTEDDVQGDHGATIGSFSAEQMEFFASRGLNEHDRVELAAQAVVDDAASRLGGVASERVIAWARQSLGPQAAEQAASAAALAHHPA